MYNLFPPTDGESTHCKFDFKSIDELHFPQSIDSRVIVNSIASRLIQLIFTNRRMIDWFLNRSWVNRRNYFSPLTGNRHFADSIPNRFPTMDSQSSQCQLDRWSIGDDKFNQSTRNRVGKNSIVRWLKKINCVKRVGEIQSDFCKRLVGSP